MSSPRGSSGRAFTTFHSKVSKILPRLPLCSQHKQSLNNLNANHKPQSDRRRQTSRWWGVYCRRKRKRWMDMLNVWRLSVQMSDEHYPRSPNKAEQSWPVADPEEGVSSQTDLPPRRRGPGSESFPPTERLWWTPWAGLTWEKEVDTALI